MHSIVFVLLPPDIEDFLQKTTELLSPYNSELAVGSYKIYLSESEVNSWAKRIGTTNLGDLAELLTKKNHLNAGVDEKGLYEMSNFNRLGRFDSWSPALFFEENPVSAKIKGEKYGRKLNRSICPVSLLKEEDVPFSLVTPDGTWRSLMYDFGYKPIFEKESRRVENDVPYANWKEHVRTVLANHPDHLVFAIDCHS